MATELQQAIKAIKSGDIAKGRRLLEQIVETDPSNEKALLGLASITKSAEKRHDYLSRVLTLNPNNKIAQREIAKLPQRLQGVKPSPQLDTETVQEAEFSSSKSALTEQQIANGDQEQDKVSTETALIDMLSENLMSELGKRAETDVAKFQQQEKQTKPQSRSNNKLRLMAASLVMFGLLTCVGLFLFFYFVDLPLLNSFVSDRISIVPTSTPESIPIPSEVITLDNAHRVQELTSFGQGRIGHLLVQSGGVAISPDKRKFALAATTGVGVYSTDNLERLQTFEPESTAIPIAVVWSPDNTQIAVSWSDGKIKILDITTGQTIQTLKQQTPSTEIISLAWSPDGTRIAGGDYFFGRTQVWNTHSETNIASWAGPQSSVLSLAWSLDSSELMIATGPGVDRVNVEQLELVDKIRAGSVTNMDWATGGNQMAWSTYDGRLIVLPQEFEGKDVRVLTETGTVSIDWSPDDMQLAVGQADGRVAIRDTKSGEVLQTLEGLTGPVLAVAWLDEAQLIAIDPYGMVLKWNQESGSQSHSLGNYIGYVSQMSWAANNSDLTLYFIDLPEEQAKAHQIWDTTTAQPVGTVIISQTEIIPQWKNVPAPDGTLLASVGDNGITIELHRPDNDDPIAELSSTHTERIQRLVWSPDGTQLASVGGRDPTIHIFDVANRREMHVLTGHTFSAQDAAWSPDGTMIATGGRNTIRIWNATSGQELLMLPHDSGGVSDISWSPDKIRLAWASGIGNVHILGIPAILLPTATPTATPLPTPTPTPTPAPPSADATTYQVGECIDIPAAGGIFIECVTSIAIRPDGTMQVNMLWGVQVNRNIVFTKFSDVDNKNIYLTDDLGNRLDHIGGGGAMAEEVNIADGESVEGWFLFPAPDPEASSFIFHDDDNLVETAPIPKQWP